MKITRFNHAAVNIHGKVDEAREFYIDVLGLPEVPIQLPGRPPLPKGAIQAFWLELGGCQVHAIGAPHRGELREPTGPHVSWYVADLDQAVGELDRARHRDARDRRGARAHRLGRRPGGQHGRVPAGPELLNSLPLCVTPVTFGAWSVCQASLARELATAGMPRL